ALARRAAEAAVKIRINQEEKTMRRARIGLGAGRWLAMSMVLTMTMVVSVTAAQTQEQEKPQDPAAKLLGTYEIVSGREGAKEIPKDQLIGSIAKVTKDMLLLLDTNGKEI